MEIKAEIETKQYIINMVQDWWILAQSGNDREWDKAHCYLFGYYMGLSDSPLRYEIELLYEICVKHYAPSFMQEAA